MKRILVTILCILTAAAAGLYTRPSYILIGQLDWKDVLTKGYFLGAIPKFFTQSMLDESFFWVLKFSSIGLLLGLIISIFFMGSIKVKSKKKS